MVNSGYTYSICGTAIVCHKVTLKSGWKFFNQEVYDEKILFRCSHLSLLLGEIVSSIFHSV